MGNAPVVAAADFGVDRVSVLNGGLQAWAAAGLALASGDESYPPTSFEPTVRPQMLARMRDVRAVVEGTGEAVLVNALAPEAFRGEGPGAYSRPGRIPGSVNVHWEQTVDEATGRFLSPADLRARLGDLGAPGTEPVIASAEQGSQRRSTFSPWRSSAARTPASTTAPSPSGPRTTRCPSKWARPGPAFSSGSEAGAPLAGAPPGPRTPASRAGPASAVVATRSVSAVATRPGAR